MDTSAVAEGIAKCSCDHVDLKGPGKYDHISKFRLCTVYSRVFSHCTLAVPCL
jgi:hypothetical protein